MQRTLGDDVLRRDDVCTRAFRGQTDGLMVMTCYDVMTYVQESTVARPQLRRPTATARWPSVSAGQRTMGPFEHG